MLNSCHQLHDQAIAVTYKCYHEIGLLSMLATESRKPMIIRSNLFSKGYPSKAQPGLSNALENHKRSILRKIAAISDLDQMTDVFLRRLVQDSVCCAAYNPLRYNYTKASHRNA